MPKIYGFRAHVDGVLRTETLLGRAYTVVPVVALVEGVIQGMTSPGPELALAEEFAKFPSGWDGRPVVMSHPVIDGTPVSANAPKVLESYQIGTLFNTRLAENKLLTEAWIDQERVQSLNEDSKAVFNALTGGSQVEVSTGYFAVAEETSGMYNNQEYIAIQRDIVPDHLALLPEGTIGACSIADGCGAPRFNHTHLVTSNDCGCGCGGTCKDTHPMSNKDKSKDKNKKKDNPQMYEGTSKLAANTLSAAYAVLANSMPNGMLDYDIISLIQNTLRKMQSYTYVIGITGDSMVVYEQYDPSTGEYKTYQRSFNVDESGQTTLGADLQEVVLTTNILPVANGKPAPTLNEDNPMTTQTEGDGAPTAPTIHKVTNDLGTFEVHMSADGTPTIENFEPKVQAAHEAPAKPLGFDELLANASPEVRESIQSGIKMHNARKNELIANLKKTGRCNFNEDQLKGMSVDMLENLASLAQVPTYDGTALPNTNAAGDDDEVPTPPRLFEAKTAA